MRNGEQSVVRNFFPTTYPIVKATANQQHYLLRRLIRHLLSADY